MAGCREFVCLITYICEWTNACIAAIGCFIPLWFGFAPFFSVFDDDVEEKGDDDDDSEDDDEEEVEEEEPWKEAGRWVSLLPSFASYIIKKSEEVTSNDIVLSKLFYET
jgi:hypothetical protein